MNSTAQNTSVVNTHVARFEFTTKQTKMSRQVQDTCDHMTIHSITQNINLLSNCALLSMSNQRYGNISVQCSNSEQPKIWKHISCSAAHPTEICELNFSAEHQVSLPGKSDVGVVDNCWYVDVQIRVLYSCGANVFPPHVANHSGHCAVERTVEQSRVQQQNRAATEKQQQRAEWRCWRH